MLRKTVAWLSVAVLSAGIVWAADTVNVTITTLPDGTIWYSESNLTPNTIVRFDPKDNSFMKWPIPSGGNVLRHFVPSKDGSKIYIASSGVNKVGVVEISKK